MKEYTRPGFTLLELTVATALAAILLGAGLVVFGGIVRDQQRLANRQPYELQNKTAVVELLRKDLACATWVTIGKNVLAIQTCCSLDAATLGPVDRPSRVTYRLLRNGSPSRLVREQQFSDDPAAGLTKELLLVGANRFDVQRLSNAPQGAPDGPTTQPRQPAYLAQGHDLPRQLALTIEFDDPEADIHEVLCAR